MKAMLLAAGRGSRLKPLTDTMPKALLSVGEQNLIEHNVELLAKSGIRDIVINVCHHAEQIMDCLGDGRRYGVSIQYSHEKNHALGTGGGINRALPLLGDEPFIVVSADIWSDFPFEPSFMKADNEVHLVLVKNPYYHPTGDYALEKSGRVALHGDKLTYANIAKIHPKLFARCKPGAFPLSELFSQAILRGQVSGEVYEGKWFNVGTREELSRLKACIEIR